MKYLIYKIYNFYNSYFPINTGKHFIARFLTRVFSSFKAKTKNGIYLDIFLSSVQDMHLINIEKLDSDLITEHIKMLKSGDVFVDIGANIGYYSFLASSCMGNNGTIYSFEPSLREFRRFVKGISDNNCKNIIPSNIAISDTNGIQTFTLSKHHTGLNKLNLNQSIEKFNFKVPTNKFDDFFYLMNIRQIDLMKIDVEGAELLVLFGMKNTLKEKKINKIIVEITPKFLSEFSHSRTQLYDFMKDLDYKSTFNSNKWQYEEIFELA